MAKPFKLCRILTLAFCLVAIGAMAPMEEPDAVWGDDPKHVVEVLSFQKCERYSSGFWDYLWGILSGRKFKYCNCIPVDLGDLTDFSEIITHIGDFFKSLPSGFWKGEIDIGIKTKDPQVEGTQKKVWNKAWVEDAGARELVIQAQAMIKSIELARDTAYQSAYNASIAELKKVKYRDDYRKDPTPLYNMSWMPAGDYTGITPMAKEEARLDARWRELQHAHLKAMNSLGGKYSEVKSAMDMLYSELIKDDGEKDPTGNIKDLYDKLMKVIDSFKKILDIKGQGWAAITEIPKLISEMTDLMNALKKELDIGGFGFSKRMVLYQLLDALLDDVVKNFWVWTYAVLDKNPTYPLGLIKDSIVPVLQDMMWLLFIVAPEKGQTKMFQVVTAMAEHNAGLIEMNEYSLSLFQDMRSWSQQAKNAKKEAIKSNISTIGHEAASTKDSGKDHKIGF